MSSKITTEHLGRIAVVYVSPTTMAQVTGNLESQRRQYDLAGAAEKAGLASVTVDDLGRSGCGSVQRPASSALWRWFAPAMSEPFTASRLRG